MFKKFFRSLKLTVSLLAAIIIISIIGTIIPQNQSAQDYIKHYGQSNYLLLNKLGILDIYHSWIFLTLLFLLSINLINCLSSRPIFKKRFLGFSLIHSGFLIIILGAIVGSTWGQKGFMQIYEGESLDKFTTRGGSSIILPFSVQLEDFKVEYYDDSAGKLSAHIKDKNIEKELSINLNQEYELENSGYHLKIEQYIPDFAIDTQTKQVFSRSSQPNNPALLVKITSAKGGIEERWVFARFPYMHFNQGDENIELIYQPGQSDIKDFKSKLNVLENNNVILTKTIEVNHPLTYKGYSFYQSSYDNQGLKWSGIQVTKDPGVGLVYTGFGFIIFGLMVNFYFKK